MNIGSMTMPDHFKYKAVYLKGRPRHEKYSDFWRRHVPMDPGRRAKIFSPFDALAGFDEAIASKEVLYENHKNEDPGELNRKLDRLSDCSFPVSVSCFVPCTDPHNAASVLGQGRYETVTGIVEEIDRTRETIQIAGREISFEDIGDIRFITD